MQAADRCPIAERPMFRLGHYARIRDRTLSAWDEVFHETVSLKAAVPHSDGTDPLLAPLKSKIRLNGEHVTVLDSNVAPEVNV